MAHPFALEVWEMLLELLCLRKWDFCTAKELKLCLQGGRDPCQLPMGTGLGGQEFVRSVGGSLVQLSALVKMSQEECVPWPLGICPHCIIRGDSYFIFLILSSTCIEKVLLL